jgi:hypothetical protein
MRLKRMKIERPASHGCTMQHPSNSLIHSHCSLKQFFFFFEKPVNSFFFFEKPVHLIDFTRITHVNVIVIFIFK